MIDLIREHFKSRAIIYHDRIVLFNLKDSIEIVKWCKIQEYSISRVEALRIYPNGSIQPCMENSIVINDEYNCWDIALDFLCNQASGDWLYEII